MRNAKVKIISALTAFAFAFAVGVAAWKKKPMSLCTVTEYRSFYQIIKGENYVNLRGYLYGGKDLGFGDMKLNGCNGSVAEVVLADEGKLSYQSQNLISELRRQTSISEVRGSSDEDKFARAEVEIIGILSEREQYCFTSRYIITVEQITPVGSLEVIDRLALADELQSSQ